MRSRSGAYAAPRPRVRYELRVDRMDDEPYRIERVEIIGHFATRDAARQHMLDNEAERKLRDRGAESLGFSDLMEVAEVLLERHYPKDVMAAVAEDPGAKLTLALRECREAMRRAG